MKIDIRTELLFEVDGYKIICEQYGDLRNAEKILLFCHGFPGSSRLVHLYNNLKNKSISIVEINYRGDKKSEGKFSFLGCVKDIKTVADFLKKKYKLPLYALGYSMGGLYVSNIINKEPYLFNKVVLLNPVVDSKELFSDKLLMDELWTHAKNILSLKTHKSYKQEIDKLIDDFNPMSFVEKLKSNIIIIQSVCDEVLEPKLARKFYSLLRGKKRYLEILNKKHDLMGDEKELRDLTNYF
tara:strand:- start:1620 stop:2339 length:720 start_codon:yes stop_codon:yes gene_type:complete